MQSPPASSASISAAAPTANAGVGEAHPFRRIAGTRIRLFGALLAGSVGAVFFVVFYYATLGHLPRAFPGMYRDYPVGVWADRLDLSQLTGSFIRPAYPSLLNWWIGFRALTGILAGLGVVYALLIAWSTTVSSVAKGIGFGFGCFVITGFTLWLAFGFCPPIQRNSLADTGFYLLGWSGWATCQLLVSWLLYGAALGWVYRSVQYNRIQRDLATKR